LFANLTIMSSFKTVWIDMVSFPTKSISLTRIRQFFLLVSRWFSPPGRFWKRWNVVGTSGSQRAVSPSGLVLTGADHSAKDNDTTEHFQNRPPANAANLKCFDIVITNHYVIRKASPRRLPVTPHHIICAKKRTQTLSSGFSYRLL